MDLFDFKEVKYLERDTNTPTFLGEIKSEAGKGGQVMITLGDRNFFVDINPQDGSWKWTPPEALADGEYSISFMTIDTAGNVSTPTQRTLIIDTTPPVAPTLLNLYDDQGAITGSFDAGKMTDDRRPTLTGIAEKGTVVYLKEGNTVIGSAKADEKTGLWTLEPTVDLADGRHNLTLVAAETFADKLREGKPSDEFSIIIGKDGDVPSDPGGVAKIIEAIDNAGSLNGSLKSGGITDDTTPELRGSAPEGSVVRIQYRNDKGEWIDGGNAVMNGNSWSWTPSLALGAGNWEFRANAGSGWTDEFKLDIDPAPAAKTEITHAYDDFGPYTGMLGNGAITDDRTPNLHGRAESNSVVYIHYRNVLGEWELLDTVIAGADGRWEYETDRLSPGNYEFQAGTSATRDVKGKPFGLQIVAQGSVAPEIAMAWDDVGKITGEVKSGGLTNDTQPELRGSAEANAIVQVEYSRDGKTWHSGSTVADANGRWSFTPKEELEYANWTFKAKTTNGNSYSTDFSLNIIESETITHVYNFENIANETITKNYVYGNLTFVYNKQDKASTAIGEKEFWGKSLIIHNSDTSKEYVQKVIFKESVDYFELTAIDWESSQSYVSFFDANGKELGRIYSTDERTYGREILRFSSKNKEISYAEIHIKGPYTEYGIDNIITQKYSNTEIGIGNHGFEALDSYQIGYKFTLNKADKLGSGLIFKTVAGTEAEIFDKAKSNCYKSLFLRNNSTYEITFGSTDKISFDYHHIFYSNRHKIKIYSTTGEILFEELLKPADLDYKKFEYVAETGKSISHIEFIVGNDAGIENPTSGDGGFLIDHIAWGVNVDSGLESFDQYANDFKFDMSRVNVLSGGVKFSGKAHPDVISKLDQSRVYSGNGEHRSFLLGDNSTYTYDFGSTEKVEFALSAVHTANQHEIIVYSTTGEILYREMIVTVGARTATSPDTYQFIAPPGKKIGHIDLVLGQETTTDDSDVGFSLDDIKWGEYVHPEVNTNGGKLYLFDENDLYDPIQVFDTDNQLYQLLVNSEDQTVIFADQVEDGSKTSVIQMDNAGNNALTLSLQDVLRHGSENLAIDDATKQIIVNGNQGDTVRLEDILPEGSEQNGWAEQAGTVTIAGTQYHVWSNGDAELLVQDGVKTELV
ncbi:Ig-like domain-containing protein [Pantoea dispersa]|uniref:Ig-like domain-containing protein n=1 Tax=Pantoea dispersa TaxID=59814 RepID=UPI002DBE1EF7|nr:Ig-like domain-containing protein [Pantoea dispersa]MEB5837574.1 Ig-like domain-containing protein [Pantoea dispersa]